jgi:hypothetical protein
MTLFTKTGLFQNDKFVRRFGDIQPSAIFVHVYKKTVSKEFEKGEEGEPEWEVVIHTQVCAGGLTP